MGYDFRGKEELFNLTCENLERWQQRAGVENAKIILAWADAAKKAAAAERMLRVHKARLAEDLREENSGKKKYTEIQLKNLVDLDPEVSRLRKERDEWTIAKDRLYQFLLQFRDMWKSSTSMRLQNMNNREMEIE